MAADKLANMKQHANRYTKVDPHKHGSKNGQHPISQEQAAKKMGVGTLLPLQRFPPPWLRPAILDHIALTVTGRPAFTTLVDLRQTHVICCSVPRACFNRGSHVVERLLHDEPAQAGMVRGVHCSIQWLMLR